MTRISTALREKMNITLCEKCDAIYNRWKYLFDLRSQGSFVREAYQALSTVWRRLDAGQYLVFRDSKGSAFMFLARRSLSLEKLSNKGEIRRTPLSMSTKFKTDVLGFVQEFGFPRKTDVFRHGIFFLDIIFTLLVRGGTVNIRYANGNENPLVFPFQTMLNY